MCTNSILTWIYVCFAILIVNIVKNYFFSFDESNTTNIIIRFQNITINAVPLIELIIGIITIIVLLVILKHKSKSIFKNIEPKKTDINYYNRNLPSQLKPAHVRMLTNDGLIDEYSVAATILDLIDRKYLEFTRNIKKEFIFNDTELFIKKTDKDISDLFLYEQYLIEWIVNGSENENASQKFGEFESLVILSFPLNNYYQEYEKYSAKIIMSIAYIIIGMASVGMSHGLLSYIAFIVFSYVLGKISFVLPMRMLNLKGVNERDAWLDLKRFLLDFAKMEEKTSDMIVLWNYYLSYSIVLDVDSIASKEIKHFFEKDISKIVNSVDEKVNISKIDLNWMHVMSKVKEINNQEIEKYNKQIN